MEKGDRYMIIKPSRDFRGRYIIEWYQVGRTPECISTSMPTEHPPTPEDIVTMVRLGDI